MNGEPTRVTGLTSDQVAERVAAGKVNATALPVEQVCRGHRPLERPHVVQPDPRRAVRGTAGLRLVARRAVRPAAGRQHGDRHHPGAESEVHARPALAHLPAQGRRDPRWARSGGRLGQRRPRRRDRADRRRADRGRRRGPRVGGAGGRRVGADGRVGPGGQAPGRGRDVGKLRGCGERHLYRHGGGR